MSGRLGMLGGALVLSGVLLIGAGAVAGGDFGPTGMLGRITSGGTAGMMGGARGGMMSGQAGMMGGYGTNGTMLPGPGESGFVAGTAAA